MTALSLSADVPSLTLPDVLDLTAAGTLTDSLRDLRGRPLTIDASRVRRLGGLCLQVLLSAHATWASDGVAISFVNGSDEFNQACALLGAAQLTRE